MTILDHVISPADAVDILGKAGVKISERTLRDKARSIGAYRKIGQAMFFLPADLDAIAESCLSPTALEIARSLHLGHWREVMKRLHNENPKAPRSKENPRMRIYFAQAGDMVKIGKTLSLSRRIDALRTGSPIPLKLLFHMQGDAAGERFFHQHFRRERSHGEWFRDRSLLNMFITQVLSEYGSPRGQRRSVVKALEAMNAADDT